jgi:hypothetical protein
MEKKYDMRPQMYIDLQSVIFNFQFEPESEYVNKF